MDHNTCLDWIPGSNKLYLTRSKHAVYPNQFSLAIEAQAVTMYTDIDHKMPHNNMPLTANVLPAS